MNDYAASSYPSPLAGLIFGALMIPILVISVIVIISYWKLFTKAGKPGWAAIIPIYNIIVLLEIIGKPIWWIFLFIIPCVNIVFAIWATNLFSKSFGQSEGFTIGLIIFPFIFYPVLAFGNYPYLGPAGLGAISTNPFNNQGPFDNPPQV
jgi:hypothetical protein